MVGSLGEVIFEVSTEGVRTFQGLQYQRQASYAEHKILNGPSLLEFTGFSTVSCSLTISMSTAMGLDVSKELETLREIFKEHEGVKFTLGGEIQGENLWVIESMTEKIDMISARGDIISAEVNLSLKEYV